MEKIAVTPAKAAEITSLSRSTITTAILCLKINDDPIYMTKVSQTLKANFKQKGRRI